MRKESAERTLVVLCPSSVSSKDATSQHVRLVLNMTDDTGLPSGF